MLRMSSQGWEALSWTLTQVYAAAVQGIETPPSPESTSKQNNSSKHIPVHPGPKSLPSTGKMVFSLEASLLTKALTGPLVSGPWAPRAKISRSAAARVWKPDP